MATEESNGTGIVLTDEDARTLQAAYDLLASYVRASQPFIVEQNTPTVEALKQMLDRFGEGRPETYRPRMLELRERALAAIAAHEASAEHADGSHCLAERANIIAFMTHSLGMDHYERFTLVAETLIGYVTEHAHRHSHRPREVEAEESGGVVAPPLDDAQTA